MKTHIRISLTLTFRVGYSRSRPPPSGVEQHRPPKRKYGRSDRVLSTDTAKQAINQLQTIINNGFNDQINQLNKQGETLSNRNNWDGPLANQFREDVWPQTHKALIKAKDELEKLQVNLQKISEEIFRAGGA